MFRRMPGPIGYSGRRLGLWEFQAENTATELIHRRQTSGGAIEEDPHGVASAFRRAAPNVGRQIHLDQK